MSERATSTKSAKPSTSNRTGSSRPPPAEAEDVARPGARRRRPGRRSRLGGGPYARALLWGTALALAVAFLTGILRTYVWILGLEPVALGVVLGEAAAVPSSVRHRRPPRGSYAYVFGLGLVTYLMVHLVFWLASAGPLPSESFLEFLRGAPSATAAPFFQSVDLARGISLATGGATAIKYWIWIAEGLLLASSATLAYRGGSVRLLKG